MKTDFEKNILCIGAGYVGGPTMVMIATKCPQFKVTVVDINSTRIAEWNSNDLPIYEPGLDEIIKAVRGRNLFFSTEIEKEIGESDIIFVSVNTPTKEFGTGAGMAADLQYWEKTARQILQYAETPKIIVEKSTLPVKTALAMERILTSTNNGNHFDVVSNPEFLKQGAAVKDTMTPDRIIVGAENDRSKNIMQQLFKPFVRTDKPILFTSNKNAELIKYAANSFLATKISFINEIANFCNLCGANVKDIAKFLNAFIK